VVDSDPFNYKGCIYNIRSDEDSDNKEEKKKKEKKDVGSDTKTPDHEEGKDVQQDRGDPIPFDLYTFYDLSSDEDSAEEKKKKKERESKVKPGKIKKMRIKVKKTEHSRGRRWNRSRINKSHGWTKRPKVKQYSEERKCPAKMQLF
jgi:hypothetical protein